MVRSEGSAFTVPPVDIPFPAPLVEETTETRLFGHMGGPKSVTKQH